MSVTCDVSKFDTSKEVIALHSLNIFTIVVTLDESKLDKSNSSIL